MTDELARQAGIGPQGHTTSASTMKRPERPGAEIGTHRMWTHYADEMDKYVGHLEGVNLGQAVHIKLLKAEVERLQRFQDEHGDCESYIDTLEQAANYLEAKVLPVLRQWITEIGQCTCADAYKDRNLSDPQCHYHEYDYPVQQTQVLIKELEGENG